MKLISRILGALLAAGLVSLPAAAATTEEATIEKSLTVLRDLQAISDTRIPDLLLSRAEGIIILPANVKVGLMFGARFGNGVMLVRNPDRSWSNPVFVSSGGGSWGFQAGGQVSDIVLVLTTRNSVEGITDGKLTLGADASAAAGPVGRTAMAATSLNLRFRDLRLFEVAGTVRGRVARGQCHPHRQEAQQALLRRLERGDHPRQQGSAAGARADARRRSHQDDDHRDERGR